MNEKSVNVADAKKHFSELLGKVAYAGQHILITKRGKPMARLVPVEEPQQNLADVAGWLENDDPFFSTMEDIVQSREKHRPRILADPNGKLRSRR